MSDFKIDQQTNVNCPERWNCALRLRSATSPAACVLTWSVVSPMLGSRLGLRSWCESPLCQARLLAKCTNARDGGRTVDWWYVPCQALLLTCPVSVLVALVLGPSMTESKPGHTTSRQTNKQTNTIYNNTINPNPDRQAAGGITSMPISSLDQCTLLTTATPRQVSREDFAQDRHARASYCMYLV